MSSSSLEFLDIVRGTEPRLISYIKLSMQTVLKKHKKIQIMSKKVVDDN